MRSVLWKLTEFVLRKRSLKRRAAMLLVFVLGFALFPVLAWRFVDPPLTGLMVKRLWQAAMGDAPWRYRHDAVGLEDISPNLVLAVLASEDQEFLDHYGFDWDAIARAHAHNRTHKRTRGASTLSQQTAKNVFLWEDRSWLRKGLEVPYTVAIELLWGKRRILEAYLNCVEFGPGIYGAEAASRTYFGTSAARLSVSQAALLAASLPAPRRNNPKTRTGFLTARAAHTMGQIPLMDRRKILRTLGLSGR
jgi:monofunctional glycosyltransferase